MQRQRDKAVVELQAVIKERDARRKRDLETASEVYLAAEHDGKSFDTAVFGFEFSTDDIREYLKGKQAAAIARHQLTQPTRDPLNGPRV